MCGAYVMLYVAKISPALPRPNSFAGAGEDQRRLPTLVAHSGVRTDFSAPRHRTRGGGSKLDPPLLLRRHLVAEASSLRKI